MASYGSDYHGNDTHLGLQAPANFPDAEENMPTAAYLDVTGSGLSSPYTTVTNSLIRKHMEEIKGKVVDNLAVSTNWKRGLRDFMGKKNNDLLDFLKVKLERHPTLGPGEVLLRRFGNPQVTPNHPSVRDMILDASGEDCIPEINAALLSLKGDTPLKDYSLHTIALYDMYKEAGHNILKLQGELKGKIDNLDRIQGKIQSLFDIDPNIKYEPLMKATEEYLQKVFEDNTIAEEYTSLIAAYRRFINIRDIVTMTRSIVAQESEPVCGICLDETVSYAVTPCGHTYCQTCSRRQHSACFFCRTPIKEKIKIYFG